MKMLLRHSALLAALSLALSAAAADGAPQPLPVPFLPFPFPPVDTLTPRVNQLSAKMETTLQRMDALQAEIRSLTDSVAAHGKSIDSLTSRSNNTETALGMVQKRVETDGQTTRANTERLKQLQGDLAKTQQDFTTLRSQLVQVESALVRHSAWIAKQKVESDTASSTASEALQRAITAGKLAEGKLVYETVLSEDMTQFEPYKWDLSASAKEALQAFAEELKEENGNIYLEIQGHTDTSGAKQLNQKLSKQRAEAVREYLNKECGIPMHRMEAVAYGDSKPIADNTTKEGRSKNRRVTVVVLQ
jgi:outer membrane protein OmpA-like peptidoglycan-associated protein